MILRAAFAMTMAAAVATAAMIAGARQGRTDPSNGPGSGHGAISGIVVDGVSGQPIDGATVSLLGARSGSGGLQQVSGARGQFTFDGLPAGDTYGLSASKAGYLGGSFGRDGPRLGPSPLPSRFIVLRDGQTLSSVRVPLWRPASLSGRIVDDREAPIAGAYVQTFTPIRTPAGERLVRGPASWTGTDGTYRLVDLAAGDYLVALTPLRQDAPDASPFVSDRADSLIYFPAARSSAGGSRVALQYGDSRSGVDLHLDAAPLARVRGRVEGLPSPGAILLRLVPADDAGMTAGAEAAMTMPSDEGSFMFSRVPEGRYVLRASSSVGELSLVSAPPLPWFSALVSRFSRADESMSVSAHVTKSPGSAWGETTVVVPAGASGDVAGVVVTMRKGATISGAVTIDGQPAAIPVVAEPADGEAALPRLSGQADASGRFSIDGLAPGAYVLRPVSASVVKSIASGGHDVTDAPIDVNAGQDADDVQIVLTRQGAAIDGSIRTDPAAPVSGSGVDVICFSADPATWQRAGFASPRVRRARVDSAGGYRLSQLPAGRYDLVAIPQNAGSAWQDPSFLQRLSALAVTVDVAWGQRQTVVLVVRAIAVK